MNGVCNTWSSRWSALQKALAKDPGQTSQMKGADSWLGRALVRTGYVARQAGVAVQ
jgi:hypothetical protein